MSGGRKEQLKEKRQMSGDKAIRVGQRLPDDCQKMTRSVCSECGATFSIVHQKPYADRQRAEKQVEVLKGILAREHVDSKFQGHVASYDLDD